MMEPWMFCFFIGGIFEFPCLQRYPFVRVSIYGNEVDEFFGTIAPVVTSNS